MCPDPPATTTDLEILIDLTTKFLGGGYSPPQPSPPDRCGFLRESWRIMGCMFLTPLQEFMATSMIASFASSGKLLQIEGPDPPLPFLSFPPRLSPFENQLEAVASCLLNHKNTVACLDVRPQMWKWRICEVSPTCHRSQTLSFCEPVSNFTWYPASSNYEKKKKTRLTHFDHFWLVFFKLPLNILISNHVNRPCDEAASSDRPKVVLPVPQTFLYSHSAVHY